MVSAMAPGIPFNYDTKSLKLTPPKLVAAGMLPQKMGIAASWEPGRRRFSNNTFTHTHIFIGLV